MNSNAKWKFVFIAIVLLLCVFGLVGRPSFPTSITQLKDNFAQQIKLGLDLQGGTHLILQVQVDEAVGLQADQTLGQLNTQFRERSIRYDEIQKLNNTQLLVRNLAPESAAAFRDLVSSTFTDWDVAPAPGEASGYVLTMRASAVQIIRQRTMAQSEETIRRRIDALGLTEPVVAPYGQADNEIVVELPGEADPNRAKSVIQAGGQLELRRVSDVTPYPSEAAALAAHGGVLPPGTELVPAKSTDPATPGGVYLVDRTPIITGRDLRSATPQLSTDTPGSYEVSLLSRLTPPAASARSPSRMSAAPWPSCWIRRSSPPPPSRAALTIPDASPAASASRKPMTWRWFCEPARYRLPLITKRNAPLDLPWAPIPSATACRLPSCPLWP